MMDLTRKAQQVFSQDLYAMEVTGVKIERVEYMEDEGKGKGCALCSVDLKAEHRNAVGGVMGGVLFTLADLAFAAAANSECFAKGEGLAWVSLSSDIQYLAQPKDEHVEAKAECVRQGRGYCVYQIMIRDGLGNGVALVTTSGARVNK